MPCPFDLPVSIVCANISSPSSGAGGSSEASGGSFRHSWASCMLEVILDDQPWESQPPPESKQSHTIQSFSYFRAARKIMYNSCCLCCEHSWDSDGTITLCITWTHNPPLTEEVVFKLTYWSCIWVDMLFEDRKLLRCSDRSEEPAKEWSPLYCSQSHPLSPEEPPETPKAHWPPGIKGKQS